MIKISPRLTSEEIELLRICADQRAGMNLLAEKIGVNRNTVRTAMHSGMCSEDTAKKIRSFLKKEKATA